MLPGVALFFGQLLIFRSSSLSIPATNLLMDPTNASNIDQILTSPDLSSTRYRCDGPRFGYSLSSGSCLNAWSFIPLTVRSALRFGDRDDGGIYDVSLPKRYLSCECLIGPMTFSRTENLLADGTCAIDPLLKPPLR